MSIDSGDPVGRVGGGTLLSARRTIAGFKIPSPKNRIAPGKVTRATAVASQEAHHEAAWSPDRTSG